MQKIFLSAFLILLTPILMAEPVQEPYIFGVHPYLTSKGLLEKFTPLIEYLSDELDRPVILRVAKTYADHIELTGKNKVDIAYMGPASYVKMVKNYGHKPLLAKVQVKGKSTFRGAIIVAPNSPIKTLADLQGKSFAFGSKYSTMSYLVPRFVLWEAGIGIEQLSNYEFVKNHENVVFGILSGAFDAGAIKEGVFEKNATEGIKVLAWTPPITEHIFVTTQNFTEHEKLQTIFLNINNHPQGKAILTSIKKSITGLAKVKNEDYDGLRNILQTVEKLDH